MNIVHCSVLSTVHFSVLSIVHCNVLSIVDCCVLSIVHCSIDSVTGCPLQCSEKFSSGPVPCEQLAGSHCGDLVWFRLKKHTHPVPSLTTTRPILSSHAPYLLLAFFLLLSPPPPQLFPFLWFPFLMVTALRDSVQCLPVLTHTTCAKCKCSQRERSKQACRGSRHGRWCATHPLSGTRRCSLLQGVLCSFLPVGGCQRTAQHVFHLLRHPLGGLSLAAGLLHQLLTPSLLWRRSHLYFCWYGKAQGGERDGDSLQQFQTQGVRH